MPPSSSRVVARPRPSALPAAGVAPARCPSPQCLHRNAALADNPGRRMGPTHRPFQYFHKLAPHKAVTFVRFLVTRRLSGPVSFSLVSVGDGGDPQKSPHAALLNKPTHSYSMTLATRSFPQQRSSTSTAPSRGGAAELSEPITRRKGSMPGAFTPSLQDDDFASQARASPGDGAAVLVARESE